jgi:hypothetical protein
MRDLLRRWLGRRTQPPAAPSDREARDAGVHSLDEVIAVAIRDGRQAERARVAEILQAPGAATFPDIAADLVLGPATGEQAAKVLARADADAATRAGLIKSNLLESTARVLH